MWIGAIIRGTCLLCLIIRGFLLWNMRTNSKNTRISMGELWVIWTIMLIGCIRYFSKLWMNRSMGYWVASCMSSWVRNWMENLSSVCSVVRVLTNFWAGIRRGIWKLW